nr:PREDICTED: uncharacterized protein LOC109032666 [Bemisia tabaci]
MWKEYHLSRYFFNPDYNNGEFRITLDIGQKYGVALHALSLFRALKVADPSAKVDFSISVDSSVLSILTPHSKFVPQYLLILRAFTLTAWIFILFTIGTFVLAQYIFQRSQCASFRRFYSEAEISSYEGTSSLLTVYSYFMCGNPPTLLLGRFHTGKILFLVFSFAAIVISTVFSSNMTTLLTKKVRYPEIDSMDDLVEADIFIQTTYIAGTSMLDLQEAIVAKLTDSLHAIMAFLNLEAVHNQEVAVYYVDPTSNLSMGTDTDDYLLKTIENAHAISETDAILQSIPQALVSKKNVDVRTALWREKMNYHLMEQGLMTYPVLFTFPKDSFLFDEVNDLLIRFLEYGHAHEYLKEIMRQEFNVTTASDDDFCDEIEPKPHSLSDLQPAFAALIIGLFISFLAFVSEILLDVFGTAAAAKHLKRFRSFFRNRE